MQSFQLKPLQTTLDLIMLSPKQFLGLYIASYTCTAWIINAPVSVTSRKPSACFVSVPDKDLEIMDADFEKVYSTKDDGSESLSEEDESALPTNEEQHKTLLDLSFESGDPRWKETRIPFCRGDEYIDGKLAFMVELEGESYGIAVPFDDAVAIVQTISSKEDDDEVTYIDPDQYEEEEENAELMEIMAKQVKENLGEDLVLRKTPKVLTISGGLTEFTDNWQRDLMEDPISVEDLLKDSDGNVDKETAEFYEFMRQELGQEEFQKTMQEKMSDEDKEIATLFDIDFDELFDEEDDLMADAEKMANEAKQFSPDEDGVALKLIGFEFTDKSKSFLLVKLLQPYTLVGKRIIEEEEGIRFELLTKEEEKVLVPKLEELCQEDLAKAGMSLTPRE
jgi:hypothetical protein